MHSSAPKHPAAELRVFESAHGMHLFVADGSRVYDIDEDAAREIRRACSAHDPVGVDPGFWASLGLWDAPQRITNAAPPLPNVRSISLNVAQACNMGCTYFYADEGRFGGKPRTMELAVAEAAIDRLIAESDPGAPLLLGFMGGEPLLNRKAVHHATRYGAAAAARGGHEMRFSITTNATLLTAHDAELFAAFPYCVQMSVDGPRERNDDARPMKNGASSYDCVVRAVELMNGVGRPRSLVARTTVTPHQRRPARNARPLDRPGLRRRRLRARRRVALTGPGLFRRTVRRLSRADDRVRKEGAGRAPRGPSVSVLEFRDRAVGDPPRWSPPVRLRRGRRVSQRERERRPVRLPSSGR